MDKTPDLFVTKKIFDDKDKIKLIENKINYNNKKLNYQIYTILISIILINISYYFFYINLKSIGYIIWVFIFLIMITNYMI